MLLRNVGGSSAAGMELMVPGLRATTARRPDRYY
jgi:hypothetical protein